MTNISLSLPPFSKVADYFCDILNFDVWTQLQKTFATMLHAWW